MRNLIKTTTLAIAIVLGTTAASFAGVAWVDEDTRVKDDPYKWADTIAWADEGEKVYCSDFDNGYAYCERSGKDGWIKKSDLDFHHHSEPEVEFCVGGGGFGGGGFGGFELCVGDD